MQFQLMPTMADLSCKKRVCTGQKVIEVLVTNTVCKGEQLLTADPPSVTWQPQIKHVLKSIKGLDAEILELVNSEDDVTEEIEQYEAFKQDMYAVLVKTEQFSF